MRANGGAVDSVGTFWLGTMNDPEEADITNEAVLFRLDTDGSFHRYWKRQPFPMASVGMRRATPSIGPTLQPTTSNYSFDFDAETGNICHRRVSYYHGQDDQSSGSPDRHARDVEDNRWHAYYGGHKVIKISPEGRSIGDIWVPTRNPTCLVFVDTKLFITSTRENDPERYPESARYARDIFRVDVGVGEMPKHKAQIP
jgi:sugar lactone lactonase YvrE